MYKYRAASHDRGDRPQHRRVVAAELPRREFLRCGDHSLRSGLAARRRLREPLLPRADTARAQPLRRARGRGRRVLHRGWLPPRGLFLRGAGRMIMITLIGFLTFGGFLIFGNFCDNFSSFNDCFRDFSFEILFSKFPFLKRNFYFSIETYPLVRFRPVLFQK